MPDATADCWGNFGRIRVSLHAHGAIVRDPTDGRSRRGEWDTQGLRFRRRS